MASRDLIHNVATVQLLAPIDKAHTNWTSNVLDTAGFESAQLIFHAGAFVGNDGSDYLTVTMEESADTVGADFTTVANADIQGPGSFAAGNPNFAEVNGTAAQPVVNATGASTDYPLGYHGSKRYIRLKGTYTGTGISSGIVGVTGQLSHAVVMPVTAPAAIVAS